MYYILELSAESGGGVCVDQHCFFVLVFFFLSNKIGKYSSTYRIEKQEIQNEILVIVC